MSTFDAPDRETCQVRRARTNTPLQALVLMNDVQFVEAARKFAERIMSEKSKSKEDKLVFAFRSVVTRSPGKEELQTLSEVFDEYLADFKTQKGSADELLKIGESNKKPEFDSNELAAWTMVAHVIMNLSEAVTKN